MDFADHVEEDFDENGANVEMEHAGLNSQEVAEIREHKDAVIFLVDMHPSMLQPNAHNGETRECNAAQVLRAALSFIKTKIITAESDRIAIVLYGQKDGDSSKAVEVLYALDQPDASLIK